MTPRATLRLQFNAGFTFDDARQQLPYFDALGISHLYASPILRARQGSTHGYDVVDPTQVNPELGGEQALRRLVAALRARGMGLIVDIVPNHMAVGEDDNPWWLDVLEWGPASDYAGYFDIDWDVNDPLLQGRVLAPFLGKSYGEALAEGELALRFDGVAGRFHCAYYSHRFPLRPADYAPLLSAAGLEEDARRMRQALRRPRAGRSIAFDAMCRALAARFAEDDAPLRRLLQLHADPQRLHRLLERQHYRLAWWRTAGDEINWRRFFDINQLAGLRTQEPEVFEAVHATLFRLYAEGLVDGLRIDHVDGLADPRAYCRRLRARLAQLQAQRPPDAPTGPAYIVVEKILAPGEKLARDWRVDGSSGYAFMGEVGAVLHDASGDAPLSALWRELSGHSGGFGPEQRRARRSIPQELFAADFNACAHALHRIARSDVHTRDWTLAAIRRVLAELLVHFPVYRTYVDARGRSAADARIMQAVNAAAAAHLPSADRPLLALVDRWLGGEAPQAVQPAAARRLRLRAVARFQQLTAPVAAKAVEDTAFYRHGRLLSRNEVGADPAQFALDAAQFHRLCADRRRRYPRTLLATATHDHKRGEDLRARLAVVSEIPQRWIETVAAWRLRHAGLRAQEGPDAIDEYMLYQMLVGAWPLQPDATTPGELARRLGDWQQKAVREAKRRSSWIDPELDYEQGCRDFLERLMGDAGFVAGLQAFVDGIAAAGALNGLVQTLLRLTTPGVPDLYQGCEFWDFSLVDPDNRRTVDFAARAASLARDTSLPQLLRDWRDGRVKQWLIRRLLQLRAQDPALFAEGDYVPLRVQGPHAQRLLAFARLHSGRALLIVVPRCARALLPDPALPLLDPADWQDTRVLLPAALRREGRELLTERALGRLPAALPAAQLLGAAPLSVVAI